MIITTGNDLAGYDILEYLGIVRGIIVQRPSFSQGFFGSMRGSIQGGNIPEYAEVCEEARREASVLMVSRAKRSGANAIIAMRYDAIEFSAGLAEVLAYGTAVKIKKRNAS